jgi:O-succinylhomoserine sulfhydrylase
MGLKSSTLIRKREENTVDQHHFETQAIRLQGPRSQFREHSAPIYMTSSFTFDDTEHGKRLFDGTEEGNVYSRYSNPNVTEFENKMAHLERGEGAIATASGMSAIFSTLATLASQGDHIISSRSIFGSTHQILTQILPRWGISSTYVDFDKTETWKNAVQPGKSKLLFLETPSNPALDLIDLAWASKFAKEHELILIVDNVFCTPYIQNPISFGADVVIHSATKYIDGQGRALGGVIVSNNELIERFTFMLRHSGPSLSPMNAWIFSKGLETLAVRMDRHMASAAKVGHFLEAEDKVEWVKYPYFKSHPQYELAIRQQCGGGGIVTFGIKGGFETGVKFMDALQMASLTPNLGDTRTILTHPASTTHSKLQEEERLAVGITGGTIRISVGLEHFEDIINDLKLGIAAV